MNNKLTLKQNSKLALNKSQNLISITNKILNNKLDLLDNSWMQKLWDWADENNIPNIEDSDIKNLEEHERHLYWKGIPRDEKKLLNVTSISLSNCNLRKLPTVLFYLTNLKQLILSNNKLDEIPIDIIKLNKLGMLSISDNNIKKVDDLIIDKLENLAIMFFDGNPLKNIPKLNARMKELDLKCNSINALMREQFQKDG